MKFHLLLEFDEAKRSCRKRLDGHNRRRRKPQVEVINTANLFSNHHSSRFTSFPQNFSTGGTDAAWTCVVKSEEETLYPLLPPPATHFMDRVPPLPHHFSSTFGPSYREGKQFFLQDGGGGGSFAPSSRMAIEPACQPLLNSISSAAESSSNSIMFSDRLSQVFDSDCALSLLSSSAQNSGINLSHMVPSSRIPMGLPLLSSLHYHASSSNVSATGFSCSAMEEGHVEADLHCQSMFHTGGEEASDCASESIPFSW